MSIFKRRKKPRSIFTMLFVVMFLSLGLTTMAVVGGGVFYFTQSEKVGPVVEVDGLTAGVYALFSVRVDDWLLADESASAVNKLIDIHEESGVLLDLYLTDQAVKSWEVNHEELINRINASSVVSVAYAIGPPRPYYKLFNESELAGVGEGELAALLADYETRFVDAVSGELVEESGGYAYVAENFENVSSVLLSDARGYESDLASVYAGLGARIGSFEGDWDFGEDLFGLYALPQHVHVRPFDGRPDNVASETIDAIMLNTEMESVSEEPVFVNVQLNESAFYASEPSWEFVYYKKIEPTDERASPAKPPFDLTAYQGQVSYLPQSVRDARWDYYEDLIAQVVQREDITPMNAETLAEALLVEVQ